MASETEDLAFSRKIARGHLRIFLKGKIGRYRYTLLHISESPDEPSWTVYDNERYENTCRASTRSGAILKFQLEHPGEKLCEYHGGEFKAV